MTQPAIDRAPDATAIFDQMQAELDHIGDVIDSALQEAAAIRADCQRQHAAFLEILSEESTAMKAQTEEINRRFAEELGVAS